MNTRKERIAQVALQLFGEKGFESTSTQLIAKEAEVSEALIFKHFGSKDTLLEYIIKSGYKRVIESNRGWLEERESLRFIYETIDLPYKMVRAEPDFWKLQSRLSELEISRKQHERFLQPMPALLEQAFRQLNYADPKKEARLLLVLIDALWKVEVKNPEGGTQELLAFIKTKYQPQ